jgi:hypothetical protein
LELLQGILKGGCNRSTTTGEDTSVRCEGHGVSLKKISPKSMLRLEYCVKDKCKMLFRNGVTSHLIE